MSLPIDFTPLIAKLLSKLVKWKQDYPTKRFGKQAKLTKN